MRLCRADGAAIGYVELSHDDAKVFEWSFSMVCHRKMTSGEVKSVDAEGVRLKDNVHAH